MHMGAKGARKKRGHKKTRTRNKRESLRPLITSEETWFLLRDAADLLAEANRLMRKAMECDMSFWKGRRYKFLVKKLRLKG